MIALVGYTGFVGSNIYLTAGDKIQNVYNSKNIYDAYATNPDLLIYAGVKAEKYLADIAPEKDIAHIREAEDNIRKINPEKLVLISTIDVFQNPKGVNEKSDIVTEKLYTYGYNRYQLELWVRNNYPDALIIRLPGLFGKNIKKNFLYDFINIVPFVLRKEKFEELLLEDFALTEYYTNQENGFYKLNDLTMIETEKLKEKFRKLGFSALNFTDSKSRFQFYNLDRLWNDIQIALQHGLTLWHSATEPVSVEEIYKYLTGESFVNELAGSPADYDYRTLYAEMFGGANGYISNKKVMLEMIKEFVYGAKNEEK